MDILQTVFSSHATDEVKLYSLYMYCFQGLSRARLEIHFKKVESTICEWFRKYEAIEGVTRKKQAQVFKKYGPEKREWFIKLYEERPILFLDEAKFAFDL